MTSSREEFTVIAVAAGITVKVHKQLDPQLLWPLVELAAKNPRVLWALRHFRHQDSWDELYRAFEIVESDGGSVHRADWVSNEEIGRFTQTANARRHRKRKGRPPKLPTSLPEAVELMRTILRGSLESKSRASCASRAKNA